MPATSAVPLLGEKSAHFFGKVLRARPSEVPAFAMRRAREGLSRPPKGLAATRFGDVVFPVDLSLHAIARKYFFRTHEMFLERIFRERLAPGAVFVDVGANLGYWSAFAAALVGPGGEVHAFEPVPTFHASVARLAAANPAYDIRANRLALGDAAGPLDMAVVAPSAGNHANFDVNIGSSSALPGFLDHVGPLATAERVAATTFDRYAAETALDLDRIGLVKIDVEGYETHCLDGMAGLLARPRRTPLLIEVLTDPARSPLLDGAKVVRRLEAHGYRCLDATTLRPIDLGALAFEENVLCL